MWRKPNEGKPSSQPANSPGSVPNQTKVMTPLPVSTESQAPVPQTPVLHAPIHQAVPAPPPIISAPVTKTPAISAVRENSAPSRIGSGLKIRGELSGNADLFVDGELQGKIALGDARVTIGPSGRVQADIEARNIVIEGSVQGNLKARESVHLSSTSRVQGSILTPRIGIDDGARLRGKVEMLRASEAGGSPASEPEKDSDVLRPVHARSTEA
jgi:cytoskeletal protein CcmA (bactofilin family)